MRRIETLLLLLATAAPLPAQLAQLAGRPVNGITCDAGEGQRIHIHQHLVIYDRGKLVDIPAYIGIPQAARCIYWLHTHTPDGFIHVEAPVDRSFTLGDFFAVWGQPLDRSHAAGAVVKKGEKMQVWVNGKLFTGDPSQVKLERHTDIVIQVGPPYAKPPRFTDWKNL